MRFSLYILLFAILELFSVHISASNSIRVSDVDLYTIEDGLSQTTVNCLIRDSKGFIWIGTQDGINKFDGYSFKVFKNDPNDSTTISNNFINSILEDDKGNIWIGTNNGLNKYNPFTGKFQRFNNSIDLQKGLKENVIYNLYQDRQGYIWVKTERFLSRYNSKSDKFRHYEHYNDVFNTSPESLSFSIFEDHRNQLWVGTKDGLNYFDRSLEIFKRYKHDPDDSKSISNNFIKVIFEDSKNNLWIGTDDGLNKFNWETEEFKRYTVGNGPNQLSNGVINDLIEDKNGDLLIATNKGISRFNYLTNEFVNNNENLGSTSFTSILRDNSENIWAGTFLGLIKIENKNKKFNLFSEDANGNPLFSNNYILSIYKESNIIYVGTWGNGLYLFDPISCKSVQFNTSNSEIGNDFVHKIFKDSKGSFWIGTQSGVKIFNPIKKEFSQIQQTSLHNLMQNNRVFDIIEDRNQNIWIGTKFGLHKLSNNSFQSFYNKPNDLNSISSNQIYDLYLDKNRNLWIGTTNGLNYLDTKTNIIERFIRTDGKCEFCISNNDVVSICEDTIHDCMWIGTMAGLNKFDFETKTFQIYTEKDGLPNNFIYSVLIDNSENLWLSTNKGLSMFNVTTNEFSNFGIKDGLQNYEFNHGAAFKSDNGEFFFGGIDGFNSFYPDSIVKNQIEPNIEITLVELLSEEGTEDVFVGRNNKIQIPHKNNLLTIEFAALDFTDSKKNKYAYKLEGVEDEWIELGFRRYATFSNLAAGNYIFKVKGSNSNNVWSKQEAILNISVVTPIWLSSFAYALYIALFIGTIFWFFQFRTRSLRKSNQDLKEKQLIALQVAKQKEELTVKNKSITDSIIYAKRIQEALMPSKKHFKNILPNSFILHKAKDIVSGDFYWINEKHDKTFIAVVDCTGHGVPGAFMSIIGFELLRNITDDQGIQGADEVLNVLNKGVATTFGQSNDNIRLKDGMDIALCVIDKKKQQLEFAGAFRPLYFIRDNKIEEIKGDRFSVGLLDDGESNIIQKTTIKLKKDDVFYIFSDGYADQFGGAEGKKYKYRRYRHLLLTIHKLPLEQQKTYLERSFEDWQGKHEQVDDVLIVGFKPELDNDTDLES
jgi:ligand-binding sensor domain-containing protein/serine phosphatase RsbU (regulator of sigma subunit)